MNEGMTSGQFAMLTRMSRKALRLYDELGLLRPAHVDPDNGYRYYNVIQLDVAQRINTLRSLGMSLEEVGEALHTWHDPALRTRLEAQRAVLHTRLAEARGALDALERLLDAPPPPYPVAEKVLAPQVDLSLRRRCLPEEACAFIVEGERQLRVALAAEGLFTGHPVTAIYHEAEREEMWDVEVCLPLGDSGERHWPQGMAVSTRPGGSVIFTVHEGDYNGTHGMQGAFVALWTWMQAQRRAPATAPYEVYTVDHRTTQYSRAFRTEIAWPIRGTGAGLF